MKAWVTKFLDQFDVDWSSNKGPAPKPEDVSEEKATLLFMIDAYSKHLFDTDKHPSRKSREIFDEFLKSMVKPEHNSDALFKFRQYFASHRLDEFTYIQHTFEDFKKIIWDFADHLNEEAEKEEQEQNRVAQELNELRDAVEANSIDNLKSQARRFIDTYADFQAQLHTRRDKRLNIARKSLSTVRKKLSEANQSLHTDHLTGAHNRKAFDEQMLEWIEENKDKDTPTTLIALDIDHFKKVNDNFGHDTGDYVLKELVNLLHKTFNSDEDFIARVGGEEFSILCHTTDLDTAVKRCNEALKSVRAAAFAHNGKTIRFTVSMGIAELIQNETAEEWSKRADTALYNSKQSGRDKYTVASHPPKMVVVA